MPKIVKSSGRSFDELETEDGFSEFEGNKKPRKILIPKPVSLPPSPKLQPPKPKKPNLSQSKAWNLPKYSAPKLQTPSTPLMKHSLAWDLHQQFQNKEGCDVEFIIGNQVMKAHKWILQLRCDYFQSLFTSNFQDNSKTKFEIAFPYEIWEALVKWMYCDVLELTAENVLQVFIVADYYCVSIARNLCEQFILENLDILDSQILFNKNISPEMKAFWTEITVKHKGKPVKKEEYSSLIDNLSLLLLKPSETFDVQFVVKNEKVLAHSFILCARSSYLKRMISNFKETGVDKPFSIPILEDYSVQDVILMRNWFYQDTFGLDIQANQATKLLTLAEKWLLPEAAAELLRALI